jgi:hypothetical protein
MALERERLQHRCGQLHAKIGAIIGWMNQGQRVERGESTMPPMSSYDGSGAGTPYGSSLGGSSLAPSTVGVMGLPASPHPLMNESLALGEEGRIDYQHQRAAASSGGNARLVQGAASRQSMSSRGSILRSASESRGGLGSTRGSVAFGAVTQEEFDTGSAAPGLAQQPQPQPQPLVRNGFQLFMGEQRDAMEAGLQSFIDQTGKGVEAVSSALAPLCVRGALPCVRGHPRQHKIRRLDPPPTRVRWLRARLQATHFLSEAKLDVEQAVAACRESDTKTPAAQVQSSRPRSRQHSRARSGMLDSGAPAAEEEGAEQAAFADLAAMHNWPREGLPPPSSADDDGEGRFTLAGRQSVSAVRELGRRVYR